MMFICMKKIEKYYLKNKKIQKKYLIIYPKICLILFLQEDSEQKS